MKREREDHKQMGQGAAGRLNEPPHSSSCHHDTAASSHDLPACFITTPPSVRGPHSPSQSRVSLPPHSQRAARLYARRHGDGHLHALTHSPLPPTPPAELRDDLARALAGGTRGHLGGGGGGSGRGESGLRGREEREGGRFDVVGDCPGTGGERSGTCHEIVRGGGEEGEDQRRDHCKAKACVHVRMRAARRPPLTDENTPKGVCRVCMTWPWPRQVGHVLGAVPGLAPLPSHTLHGSKWATSTFRSHP